MYRIDQFSRIVKALRQCGVPVPVAEVQVTLMPAEAAPKAEAGRDA